MVRRPAGSVPAGLPASANSVWYLRSADATDDRPLSHPCLHPAVPDLPARLHLHPHRSVSHRAGRAAHRQGGARRHHLPHHAHAGAPGARHHHPDGAARRAPGEPRPAVGRSRVGRAAGLRREYLPHPAAGRLRGAPRVGCHLVRHHLGGPRRQPDLPRDHLQHRRRADRERSQAPRLLRGLPESRPVCSGRAEDRRGLARRVPGRHDESRAARRLPGPKRADAARSREADRRAGARGRHRAPGQGGRARVLHGQPVPEGTGPHAGS